MYSPLMSSTVGLQARSLNPCPVQQPTFLFSAEAAKPILLKDSIPAASDSLQISTLPCLTSSLPLPSCRVSVIIPVRNEAENMPAVISALAHQIDVHGNAIDPASYEVLILANNCTDNTAAVVQQIGLQYPQLQLQAIEVSIPKEIAHVGKARQMVMNEAYRRLSSVKSESSIIASTDGDTDVVSNWISSIISEFDKGVDAVGGRIITRRAEVLGASSKISLYYLRRLAHAYFAAQIECFLDPQEHDGWPRHFQYCGANMAVSAEMYGRIGGMPLVKHEEDVALYRQLQRADAKIRHSLDVRVLTSARQVGRATGGLSELLETLSHTSKNRQIVLVESPEVTEARILVRRHLREVWNVLQYDHAFKSKDHAKSMDLLAQRLGITSSRLRQHIENAATFGELVDAIASWQTTQLDSQKFGTTTEISVANMHLRQRLQTVRHLSTTQDYL